MNSILSALLKPITTYDNKSSLNLNLTDKKPTEENNDKSNNVADNYIFSDEAQEEMIEINGTDGNDKIKASVKNGKIIIDVNGQKQEYTSEEAQKGFIQPFKSVIPAFHRAVVWAITEMPLMKR